MITSPPCSSSHNLTDLELRRHQIETGYWNLRYYINYPAFHRKVQASLDAQRGALEAEEAAAANPSSKPEPEQEATPTQWWLNDYKVFNPYDYWLDHDPGEPESGESCRPPVQDGGGAGMVTPPLPAKRPEAI
jgi:hypothetical protein